MFGFRSLHVQDESALIFSGVVRAWDLIKGWSCMSYEVTLIYTEPLLRQAVYAYWRRTVGAGFVFALALLAVSLGWFVIHGEDTWIVGALAAVLVLGVAFSAALYFVHYRNTLRKFREMGAPEATFRADESSFTFSTGIGTTTLQWSAVKELWQFSEVWLLLYSKAQFSTLPLACLPLEMRGFILRCVRAWGGKVAD